ncbi:hypothetical protein CDL12_15973 [Handroanthus impetiginosus]|uniref:AIG1-type G domain-containing protein n=1 Tax=Handroanthus impetiginosus TaxID=429701 RepID=A0A2G9H1M5_9LAMI|nr:hypothetical protein CDL12_15973 [Handroanthus impetiginosus]
MGGVAIYDDWEFPSPLSAVLGVTSTFELQIVVLEDGHILNVIDTPGLFDYSDEPESIREEIVKCVNMAKDGIHAVLVVLSVRSRFTQEEGAVIKSFQEFFGNKISDYMIVVFTGSDDLEENGETLDDYLGRHCPEPLKETLKMCGNRCVVFDNKTKDEYKKYKQLRELLSFVNNVVENNGGKPYTDQLFVELKAINSSEGYSKQEISDLQDQFQKSYEDLLKQVTEMVESKLQETIHGLEQLLAKEQAARLKAEAMAQSAQKKSNAEIRKLMENLERARRETEVLQERAETNLCNIL